MNASDHSLAARTVADFTKAHEGLAEVVCYGIGLDGEVLSACRTEKAEVSNIQGPWSFPKSQLDAPRDYVIHRIKGNKVSRTTGPREPLSVHYVQPLPQGFLLVGARSFVTDDGPELNAALCDAEGRVLRRLVLGDAIADVRTTPAGKIWVSYFDEGTGYDELDERLGASGLVEFDTSGERLFTYADWEAGTGSICDVNALNVAGEDDVWVYFYGGFPIVRIQRGEYRVWGCEIAGAKALAARDDRVLLYGGSDQPDVAHLLELGEDGVARIISRARIVDETAAPLVPRAVFGVADRLYLVDGHRVLVVEGW